MRKEKPIDPKQLLQKAREAEYHKLFIENELRNNEPGKTHNDLIEAQTRLESALAALEALPPPPVLPPRGQLEKITGRLEEFSRIRCKADFMPDFYISHPYHQMSSGEKAGMGAAAIAFDSPALAGLALKEELPMSSDADYIKGMINGKPFAGWVGLTYLKVGDEVELAAEWQDDHYQVYAIALPAERVVSVCPRADHGRYIQAKLKIKHTVWFVLLMLIIIHGIQISMIKGSVSDFMYESIIYNKHSFYVLTLTIVLVGGSVIGLLFYSIYLGYAKIACAFAENIFHAYEWKKPKNISLGAITSKKEKELKRNGGWYSPGDKSNPPRPTTTWVGFMEFWYYY
ncbi:MULTISPECIES: putative type VI secretion system effector [Pantoea]|uniref:Uncharacterized protein n=2 Tax=Pantoea TaxID=53335 RepID=A0A0U3UI64_9GAMM|nr:MULTISPECIES: putative type VI secretion system effector [Pantoea]ALV93506.1 hypothetical protein LK04_15720 [Pantoea vagans]KHJ68846.1 hypothetical protein QU24_06795 [Pantoea rodasii]